MGWEKERDAARASQQPYVVNAIWVLMGELKISEDEARVICRCKIRASVADYLEFLRNVDHGLNISRDLHIYLEAIRYSISGNLVWSEYCPRYHPVATFDPTTLSMMDVH